MDSIFHSPSCQVPFSCPNAVSLPLQSLHFPGADVCRWVRHGKQTCASFSVVHHPPAQKGRLDASLVQRERGSPDSSSLYPCVNMIHTVELVLPLRPSGHRPCFASSRLVLLHPVVLRSCDSHGANPEKLQLRPSRLRCSPPANLHTI